MKTVLCYGDSNTYGFTPSDGNRFPEDVRWTGRLASALGPDYRVIEEGCNGRTTVFDEPAEPWKNGMRYIHACLNSHKPIDVVVLMLGTNDLKDMFGATAPQIAGGAGELVKVIRSFTPEKQGFIPAIVLVSPIEVGPGITSSPFAERYSESAVTRSKEFPALYRRVAEANECIYLNAAEVARPSLTDSLHMDEESHAALAKALYEIIKDL